MTIFSVGSFGAVVATKGYDTRLPTPIGTPYSGNYSIMYDALAKAYFLSGPIAGRFDELISSTDPNAVKSDAHTLVGGVQGSTGPCCAASLSVARPGSGGIALTYSTIATMRDGDTLGIVNLAFGLATPAAGIPVAGTATYVAKTVGATDASPFYYIVGDANLAFNFGTGTLSGYFDPLIGSDVMPNTPLGHYTFTNTVYSAGSTTFSGSFGLPSGVSGYSAFDGQFTGPAAQELIGRFQAPFSAPGGPTGRMYGVWVGAKQ